ncbi:unnamed protein product [Caenorhabditis angaria]|uniref:Uncharacterized protein n=1 Tax=Caenorhabditis angaria TaxID=860376 RepID=A0A9P1J6T4_9PELO|nr:unnamed protein product [Caenorhabditis angaria]
MTIKVGNFSGNKKIDEKHEDVAETKPPRLNMSLKTIFIIFMLPQVLYWIGQIYKFGWTQERALPLIWNSVTTLSVIFNIGEIMAIFVLLQLRYYVQLNPISYKKRFAMIVKKKKMQPLYDV